MYSGKAGHRTQAHPGGSGFDGAGNRGEEPECPAACIAKDRARMSPHIRKHDGLREQYQEQHAGGGSEKRRDQPLGRATNRGEAVDAACGPAPQRAANAPSAVDVLPAPGLGLECLVSQDETNRRRNP